MSKTTPVRWWRDDATRYDDRPLVGVCRSWTQPTLEWTYEPPSPERQAELERLSAWIAERQAEFWRSMMLPAELVDPISDIKAFFDDQRREIERINRSKP